MISYGHLRRRVVFFYSKRSMTDIKQKLQNELDELESELRVHLPLLAEASSATAVPFQPEAARLGGGREPRALPKPPKPN